MAVIRSYINVGGQNTDASNMSVSISSIAMLYVCMSMYKNSSIEEENAKRV